MASIYNNVKMENHSERPVYANVLLPAILHFVYACAF